jgi:hypothetical protein
MSQKLSATTFSGVRVNRSLVLCVIFCRSLFVLFPLAIVLSVLQFTDSDFPMVSSNPSCHVHNISSIKDNRWPQPLSPIPEGVPGVE